MNIILIGRPSSVRSEIEKNFLKNEHEVNTTRNRSKPVEKSFDLCVDMSAGGIGDIRRVLTTLKNNISHYILVSTHRVFPQVAKYAPWNPEDIDLCDETGFTTLAGDTRQRRAAERELRLSGSKILPWTILRPPIVETKIDPDERYMWWFISRILDGGPIVLPDNDDYLFRHLPASDLASAILAVSCRPEAYFQTLHIVNQALHSFESYAALLMKTLNKKVPMIRVPKIKWDAVGLELPMGPYIHSSVINDSPLLSHLGWQPTYENQWVGEYARHLAENPLSKPPLRKLEQELPGDQEKPIVHKTYAEKSNWRITGVAGNPMSFSFDYGTPGHELATPLLRTLKVTMGTAEEQFLIVNTLNSSPQILGHNVLLELLEPGNTRLSSRSLYLPVAQHPCGVAGCTLCNGLAAGLAGVDADGFATAFVTLPEQHLVPVPHELGHVALLADPLACLLAVLPGLLQEIHGPVWIFGRRIDALLASFIVQEMNRFPVHIDRTPLTDELLPDNIACMTLPAARDKVRSNSLDAPEIVLNVSGSPDGENLLAGALADGGTFISPFTTTGVHQRRLNVQLPLAAPGRHWLERSIDRIGRWSMYRDLDDLVQPLHPEQFREIFLCQQFKQPCINTVGADI